MSSSSPCLHLLPSGTGRGRAGVRGLWTRAGDLQEHCGALSCLLLQVPAQSAHLPLYSVVSSPALTLPAPSTNVLATSWLLKGAHTPLSFSRKTQNYREETSPSAFLRLGRNNRLVTTKVCSITFLLDSPADDLELPLCAPDPGESLPCGSLVLPPPPGRFHAHPGLQVPYCTGRGLCSLLLRLHKERGMQTGRAARSVKTKLNALERLDKGGQPSRNHCQVKSRQGRSTSRGES